MKKTLFVSFFALLLLFFAGCATVPLTGRTQLIFIPDETMLSMSYQQYDDFLKSNKISTDRAQVQRVKDVGERVQRAVERYMAENNLSSELKSYKWEFNLIESKEINAWCMPGGKVVVYTGILPLAPDDAGLAVVISHEIAHAIAKHGAERMSQSLLVEFGGVALSAALSSNPSKTKSLWMGAYGAGAQYGILLPYSRLQESEADRLGLIFMAMAGYDPNAALAFWERMSKTKEGKSVPEFLSTHPSDQTRINNIRSVIPEAMKYYRS